MCVYSAIRGNRIVAILRYVSCVAGMLVLTSCAGQFELSRRSLVAQPRGVSVHAAAPAETHAPAAPLDEPKVADEVADVNELCTKKQTTIQDRQTAARAKTSKSKLITATTTGLLGTIGGGTTAGASASDNKNLATGVGIATAVVSAVGTIVTIVFAPGDAEIEAQNKRMGEITDAIEDYNKICSSEPNTHACRAKLGKVRGYCAN
jgi:hypothetical protein